MKAQRKDMKQRRKYRTVPTINSDKIRAKSSNADKRPSVSGKSNESSNHAVTQKAEPSTAPNRNLDAVTKDSFDMPDFTSDNMNRKHYTRKYRTVPTINSDEIRAKSSNADKRPSVSGKSNGSSNHAVTQKAEPSTAPNRNLDAVTKDNFDMPDFTSDDMNRKHHINRSRIFSDKIRAKSSNADKRPSVSGEGNEGSNHTVTQEDPIQEAEPSTAPDENLDAVTEDSFVQKTEPPITAPTSNDIDISTYMSDLMSKNCYWDEFKGLFTTNCRGEELIISNAIVYVKSIVHITNKKTGQQNQKIELAFIYAKNDVNTNIYDKTISVTEEEIKNKKFCKQFPLSIIVEPKFTRKAPELFQYVIQKQLLRKKPIEKTLYEYGWNGHYFFFGDECGVERANNPETQYGVCCKLAEILADPDSRPIIVITLAVLHGHLRKLLDDAQIRHTFVTNITGESGIGKSSLINMLCNYNDSLNTVFTMSSNRKELLRLFESTVDRTIAIDDFHKTDSRSLLEAQKRNLYQIVQSYSDSGKVLIDERSGNVPAPTMHLIISGESFDGTISFLNRCFWLEMTEPLPKPLWNQITAFCRDGFRMFVYGFVSWIAQNYEGAISKLKDNYSVYLAECQKHSLSAVNGNNRLLETAAIQFTIKKLIVDYFNNLQIDRRLVNKADNAMQKAIWDSHDELASKINDSVSSTQHMKYLKPFYEVIMDTEHFALARSEKKYFSRSEDKSQRPYIGIVIQDRYLSFRPERICPHIAALVNEESIPTRVLIKELDFYNLLHKDSNGKASCRWGTEKRMYHVYVEELFHLMEPDCLDPFVEVSLSNFRIYDD